MSSEPIQIKRYPNRRYYAREPSKYVSLQDIEQMIQQGRTVQIRDSQSGEDLTRTVLTQIILERQPDKMRLFPTDMLHFILRSNEVTGDFLRDYFRHSLTYLEYLQRHSAAAKSLASPVHWVRAWLDGLGARPSGAEAHATSGEPPQKAPTQGDVPAGNVPADNVPAGGARQEQLTQRIEELEQRIKELETRQ